MVKESQSEKIAREFLAKQQQIIQLVEAQEGKLNELNQKIAQLEKANENQLTPEKLQAMFGGKNNFDNDGNFIGSFTTKPSTSITPVVDATPLGEEEIEWNNFFLDKGDISNQTVWKQSGLSIEDAEKVYNNGWKDQISSINKDGKLDYNGDKDLDAQIINKSYLDTANRLLQEINDPSKRTFKSLPEDFRATEIKDLTAFDIQLPDGKKSFDLIEAIKTRRNTFVYYLNEPNNEIDGDGLINEDFISAKEKQKEQWKPTKFMPVTNQILNQLLADELATVPVDRRNEPEVDLTDWLIGQGGYQIDKETTPYKIQGRDYTGQQVWAQEEEWINKGEVDKQGTLLLPYLYAKFGFVPDKIRDGQKYGEGNYIKSNFCRMAVTTEGKETNFISKSQGCWPFPTASGKTTKFTSCLVRGGLENVIIVSPTGGLAQETYNHHTGWLRKNENTLEPYKCVYHLEAHGEYPVVKNDLVYYRNDNKGGVIEGQKGLSILEGWCLNVFLNRELAECKYGRGNDLVEGSVDAMKKIAGKENSNFEANCNAIKDKLISKEDTILLFDESDFVLYPPYQQLEKDCVKLGYNVMLMTAIFKGKIIDPSDPDKKRKINIPFSITTSYPRKIVRQNVINIPDEQLAKSRTLIFFKEAKLTKKQRALLEDPDYPISYCEFDETTLNASTGITKGSPLGSVFIADTSMERGFTPFVHIVILTNRMQTTSLCRYGKKPDGKPFLLAKWDYGDPEVQSLPIASLIQQIGRISRIMPGLAIILNNFNRDENDKNKTDQAEEIDVSKLKNISCTMMEACLTGDVTKLKNTYAKFNNVKFLRNALALPYKYGLEIEEVLIGLGTSMVPNYPYYGVEPTDKPYSQKLWKRHMGIKEKVVVDPRWGKERLSLMIKTYIENQPDFPKQFEVGFDSPLIKDVDLTVEDIRKVLNTALDEKLSKAKGYRKDKIEYTGAEKDTFNKAVDSCRLTNGVLIGIYWQYKDKGNHARGYKDDLFLAIIYPKMSNERQIEFDKSFMPYKSGEVPPKITTRALGEPIISQMVTWTCKECRTINESWLTCRNCGWWKDANAVIEQEAKIEITNLTNNWLNKS